MDNNQNSAKEQATLSILADAVSQMVIEKRRERRWRLFFRFLFIGLLFYAVLLNTGEVKNKLLDDVVGKKTIYNHVAMVEINGVIDGEEVSSDDVIKSLNLAFSHSKTVAIIIRINSPGGSPVQSSNMYNEIIRLKGIYPEKPIYAVIDDICASAGYYVASAATEIYANKSSLVGSIGVISSGFGFVEVMKKIGVTRRLHTSGDNKAFLDPFSETNEKQSQHWQKTLNNVHEQFIASVKKGRGNKIKHDPIIFSGMIWSGEDALKYGLIDGFGDSNYVVREILGIETIVNFSQSHSVLDKFLKGAKLQIKSMISEELNNKALLLK